MAPPKKSTKVQTAETRKHTIVKPRATGENIKQKMKTYYIDEESQSVIKPSSDSDEVVELDDPFAHDEILEATSPGVVDGEIITLVESQKGNSNVNYFVIMQENELAGQSEDVTSEIIHISNDDAATDSMEENARSPEKDVDFSEDDVENLSSSTRAPVTELRCELCNYGTKRKYLLQRHMSCHSDIRPFTCKVCERRFKTAIALSNHMNTHKGIKPHNCTNCVSSFTTSGELLRHIRYKHSNDKPHKCTECDYASVEMSKLRRHKLCHTGERPYQCTHCTYASQDNFKLKRHMRTHTGEKPYKCTDCPMSFTQSNSLKVHMLIHNCKDKPVYACELCPVTCGRKPDLRIHMQKQHTSAEPIKCKKCSKTFPDKHTYKIHAKIHDGEKLKCSYCTYETSDIRSLNSHVLKHADQKPFVCDKCDQTFRQKQLLRRHQNVNHNPEYVPKKPKVKAHECPKCNRSYAHMGNYLRHKASHDNLGDDSAEKESRPKRQYRRKTAASDGEATEDFDSYNDQADSDDENLMKVAHDLKTKLKNGSNQADNHKSDDGEKTALDNKGNNKNVTATVTSATVKKKTYSNCFGFDEGDEREENGDDTRVMCN